WPNATRAEPITPDACAPGGHCSANARRIVTDVCKAANDVRDEPGPARASAAARCELRTCGGTLALNLGQADTSRCQGREQRAFRRAASRPSYGHAPRRAARGASRRPLLSRSVLVRVG